MDTSGNQPEEAFYGGAAGGGKLCPVDSLVLTPFGWKRNGDIRVGDVVVDPRTGGSARVVLAHPTVNVRVWEVELDDGAVVECGGDHLWTYRESGKRRKSQDRIRTSGCNDDWLDGFVVGTTEQMKHLVDRADRQQMDGTRPNWVNIPVARAAELTISHRYPDFHWPIDPYVMGVMLGDGSWSKHPSITGIDTEIDGWVEEAYPGETVRVDSKTLSIRAGKLRDAIRSSELLGKRSWEKYIPKAYLLAPLSVRVPLMQGLIDTDGYVDERGHTSYTSTSLKLAEDVQWLARSLGASAKITTKEVSGYRDKDGEFVQCRTAYNVWIKAHDPSMFSRLTRKRSRSIPSQTQPLRQVVAVRQTDRFCDMRCITLDTRDGLYIVGEDFVVTHNSEALLMAAAQYVEVPGYSALILRKTLPDLNQSGALIPRSHEWWDNTRAQWRENQKKWTFPSGATIRFGFLEKDQHMDNYMGSEYQFIGFDEATQFPYHQYGKLRTRLRKKKTIRVPLRVRCGSNPGNVGHEWVRQYFIVEGAANGRVFVSAKLQDNPSLDAEEYTRSFSAVDPVTRAQWLEGDWSISSGGASFRREWFTIEDQVPAAFERVVRYWDTAATAPIPGQEHKADWTVGTKVGRMNGEYWVLDVVRFQGSPGTVENLIRQTAIADGEACEIFIEQEPGASGKSMVEDYQFRVLPEFYVQSVRPTGPKAVRASRLASASEARRVHLFAGEWIMKWLAELESFPFGRNDDQVDSASGAYNALALGGELRPAGRDIRAAFSWQTRQ